MLERNTLDTGRKTDRMLNILNRIPVFLLMLFILFVLAASFFWRAEFCGYRYGDKPVWNRENPFGTAVSVIGMILLFMLVYFLGEKLGRFSRKAVITGTIGLSVAFQ